MGKDRKNKRWIFFKKYTAYRKREIILFLLFCVIFAVSFLLYHLPIKAVAYPVLLCSIVGIGVLAVGMKKAFLKHEELERISKLSANLMRNFPEPDSVSDEDS